MQEINDMRDAIKTRDWKELRTAWHNLEYVIKEKYDKPIPEIEALYTFESMLFQTIYPTDYYTAEKLLDKLEETVTKSTKIQNWQQEAAEKIWRELDRPPTREEMLDWTQPNMVEQITAILEATYRESNPVDTDLSAIRGKLEQAIIFASEAHFGQVDKQGRPYISHCLRVMSLLTSDEDKIVGVLHDTIEDTRVTYEDVAHQFGEDVACCVRLLSRPKHTPYVDYIRSLTENPRCIRVKRADLRDNLRENRLRMLPEKLSKHFREKYTEALAMLPKEGGRNG